MTATGPTCCCCSLTGGESILLPSLKKNWIQYYFYLFYLQIIIDNFNRLSLDLFIAKVVLKAVVESLLCIFFALR